MENASSENRYTAKNILNICVTYYTHNNWLIDWLICWLPDHID